MAARRQIWFFHFSFLSLAYLCPILFKKFDFQLNRETALKIGKRALLIFLIGILLRAFPFTKIDISSFRIFGVLQRIAIAYAFGALICLYLKNRRSLLLFSAVTLLAYWLILWAFGGNRPYDLETNVVRQVDILLFGENHLWRGHGIPFDPEGLLSSIPAVISGGIGFSDRTADPIIREKSAPVQDAFSRDNLYWYRFVMGYDFPD